MIPARAHGIAAGTLAAVVAEVTAVNIDAPVPASVVKTLVATVATRAGKG